MKQSALCIKPFGEVVPHLKRCGTTKWSLLNKDKKVQDPIAIGGRNGSEIDAVKQWPKKQH